MFSYLFKYKEKFPFFLLFPIWVIICHSNLLPFLNQELNLSVEPLLHLIDWQKYWLNFPYISHALFGIILFFQAWLINRLFQKNSITDKNTYLAAACYVLLLGLLNTSWILSPAFLATTFIILSLNSYLQSYSKRLYAPLFNTAFYIGIASLIYPPSALFVIPIFIAHFFIRLFNLKEWLTSFIGFIVPIYLFVVGLYFTDNISLWWEYFNLKNYFQIQLISINSFVEAITLLFLLISVVFSIYKYQYLYLRSAIEERDKIVICLYFLIVGLVAMIIFGASWQQVLVLNLPTISIFMAYGIYNTKNLLFAEWLPISLLVVVLFLHHLSGYFSYFNFFNF